MYKKYIEYDGCMYQVSAIYNGYENEIMIFPVINNIVSGNEVYAFRYSDDLSIAEKFRDITKHPEKYLSKQAIDKYLNSKEEDFKLSDVLKFVQLFEEMYIKFEVINKTDYIRLRINEQHLDQSQYSPSLDILFDKNGNFFCFEPFGE